jgi:ComF family protein
MLLPLAADLVNFFYPKLCAGCAHPLLPGEPLLCLECEGALELVATSGIDGDAALRLAGKMPFLYATSLLYFRQGGLGQHLIHALKYKGKQKIGRYLGGLLAEETRSWGYTAIAAVPLHKSKERKRGYNQSHTIATEMGSRLGIPVLTSLVVRHRPTERQTDKNISQRRENVKDAFRLGRDRDLPAGTHLLLIDDVLTTGATLEACAAPLLALPGLTISVATAGIATL